MDGKQSLMDQIDALCGECLWAFGLTGTDDDDDDDDDDGDDDDDDDDDDDGDGDGDGVGSGSGQLARPNGSPVLGRKHFYTKRNSTCP